MKSTSTYVVVTPVRDEVAYVGKTFESVVQQTCRPRMWVIVDDGSTDGTSELLDDYARRYPWINVVHRMNRGFRAAGDGVMEAFYAGYALIEKEKWDYVVKLDGDLSFRPDYFERCFERFDVDLALGIAGGTICSLQGKGMRIESVGDPHFHVRGATKIYRRNCWNQISPLIKSPGWDTLDEVRANLLGWKTQTFPEFRLVQHKPTGSAAGSWSNSFKNGKANYITGYHPAFMAAKCVKRLLRRPYLVEAVGLSAGFLSSYIKRLPQLADPETIKYLRGQQVRRLLFKPSIYD